MFNKEDEESEVESSDVSVDEEPEFGQPTDLPKEEEEKEEEVAVQEVDQWKPKPYPDSRKGLHVNSVFLRMFLNV